jgi:large subunit ribosomal protein L30
VAFLWTKYLTDNLKSMAKLKITQKRSVIGRPARQKATMEALGLRKINATVEVEGTPQVLGMVRKVSHLVEVVEL